MRRVVVFNYNSKFAPYFGETIARYNESRPGNRFVMDMYLFDRVESESDAGPADVIIHSGGDGRPVRENVHSVPKIYICHSHEWKAQAGGGELIQLSGCIKGVQHVDILEEDDILGTRGKMPIMKYHELAITTAPWDAEVLAVSKALDEDNRVIEIIEALKYDDGSISIQGHPEEGTAEHIIHNMFDRVSSDNLLQPAR